MEEERYVWGWRKLLARGFGKSRFRPFPGLYAHVEDTRTSKHGMLRSGLSRKTSARQAEDTAQKRKRQTLTKIMHDWTNKSRSHFTNGIREKDDRITLH